MAETLEQRRLLATIGYYDIQFGEGSSRQDQYFNPSGGQQEGLVHDFVKLDDLSNTDFTDFDAIIVRNAGSTATPYQVALNSTRGETNPLEFLEALADREHLPGLHSAVRGGVNLLIHDHNVNQTLTNEVLPGDATLEIGSNYFFNGNQRFVDFADVTTVLTSNPDNQLNDGSLDYNPDWGTAQYMLYGGWADVASLPGSHDLLVTGEDIGTYPGASRATTFAYDYGAGRVTFSSVLQASATGGLPGDLLPPLRAYEKNLTILAIGDGSDTPDTDTNTAPAFTQTPGTRTVQYSDDLAELSFAASDAEDDVLTARLVSDSDLGLDAPVAVGQGVWSIDPVTIDAAAGEYAVTVAVSDGVEEVEHTFTVAVAPEDATVEYTGLQHFTIAEGDATATVRLRALISDISATDDADGDSAPGDIRNAQVRFFNMDTQATLATVDQVTVAAINPDDAVMAYAVADVEAALFPSNPVHVGVEVSGGYYAGYLAEGAVVTVAESASGRVSGGGRMTLTTASAGLFAGDAETDLQYGLSARFNRSTGLFDGGVELSFYSGGEFYRVSSTEISSLAAFTEDGSAQARIAAKVDLYRGRGAKRQELVAQGLGLEATVVDGNGSTASDALGLTVWGAAGTDLWFSSLWGGNSTEEQELERGNVRVWDE